MDDKSLPEKMPDVPKWLRERTDGHAPGYDIAIYARPYKLRALADYINKLEDVVEAARALPRETPAQGTASTVHDFKIEAGDVWGLDLALKRLDAPSA